MQGIKAIRVTRAIASLRSWTSGFKIVESVVA